VGRDPVGFGTSAAGSVGDFAGAPPGTRTIALRAAPNSARAAVRAWPANGMTGIPTRWLGGESPDPLANYSGDKGDVGPTFFAASEQALTLTLRRAGKKPGKPIPLLLPNAATARPKLTLVGGYGDLVAYFPARRLKANTRYALVGKVGGRTLRFAFRTAKADGATA
jgi:hypothetical protein